MATWCQELRVTTLATVAAVISLASKLNASPISEATVEGQTGGALSREWSGHIGASRRAEMNQIARWAAKGHIWLSVIDPKHSGLVEQRRWCALFRAKG